MKKILFLNTVYRGGGAAKVARQIFEYLGKNSECDVYFAHGRGMEENNSRILKFGNKIEFYLHVFLVRVFGLEGFGSYFSTKKLINFIRRENFDVIHVHNIHGYYLNFFKLIKFLGKIDIKIIWTLHDEWCLTWMPAYSLGCKHCKTLKGKCCNFNIYPATYNKFIAEIMFSRKKRYLSGKWNPVIVCPASWIKDEVMSSYLSDKSIFVIYNGIDIDLFRNDLKNKLRDKYSLPKDKIIILFSAVNIRDKRKGGEYLMRVMNDINNEKILFLAVGSGELKNSNGNLINMGYINNENQMRDIYSASDLYLFPSLAETMPLSVLEAMSCGIPVISLNIPPVIEIFRGSSLSDLLISDQGVEGLVKKIKGIVFNRNKLINIGLIEREIIKERFCLDRTFKEYLSLYNE